MTAFEEAGNKVSVLIQKVRMPLSTQPARMPIVENIELLKTEKGLAVYSTVDTNRENPGYITLTYVPSKF